MELECLPFSLGECVRESLKVLASLAREKHIRLALQIQPGTPDVVIGDPQRIRQILLNLVSNAIKFTERGGITISIDKEREEGQRVHLHIEVADTGIGIPPEKLAVIFEPFRQADGSTTRKYGGTGLGLAICARLVKLMNGTLEVESCVGSGSRFHIRLPLARTPVQLAREEPEVSLDASFDTNGNGWPLQVLLVEDDPVSRRIASRILEKRGYTVVTAENGREALEVLDQVPVELILMDVQMPEVDGLTATRIIREREGVGFGHRLPIYILTANAMSGDRERCMAAGADGYLTKPLEPADLHRALDEIRLRING
jgi:CheY-like chemotaxis protein